MFYTFGKCVYYILGYVFGLESYVYGLIPYTSIIYILGFECPMSGHEIPWVTLLIYLYIGFWYWVSGYVVLVGYVSGSLGLSFGLGYYIIDLRCRSRNVVGTLPRTHTWRWKFRRVGNVRGYCISLYVALESPAYSEGQGTFDRVCRRPLTG